MSKSIAGNRRQGIRDQSESDHARSSRQTILAALDTLVELIEVLIPIGLEAVSGVPQREAGRLGSLRYSRSGGVPVYARWSSE